MDPFSIHIGDRILNQELGIDFKGKKKVKNKAGRKPNQKTKTTTKHNGNKH